MEIVLQCAQLHSKVTSDWPMAALHMKEELKCVTMDSGGLSVMTGGVEMMLELLASSLDSLRGVRYYHNNNYSHYYDCTLLYNILW